MSLCVLVHRCGFRVFVVTALVAILSCSAHADQSIVLRSGNGAVGTQDAQVRYLSYGADTSFTPTTEQFQSIQSGPFAYVDSPYPTYIASLPSDPLAQWVDSTNNLTGTSALYAIPFTITDSVIAAASLDLGYAVDNAINGIYINGMPISNNIQDGDYHGEYYVLRSDIAPLLKPNAVNWLYLNTTNTGSYSGLIFSATIATQGTVPGVPTITPNRGGNSGSVSVRIIASGFQPGATLSLTGSGNPIPAANVTIVSPNILTGTLDLSSAAAGTYTVSIANPGGSPVTIQNGFTVISGGAADVQIQKVGTPAVDNRNETFFITLTNAGTVDSGTAPVNEFLQPWFSLVSVNPAPTTTQDITSSAGSYPGLLEWGLPNIPPGQSATIAYTVLVNKTVPSGTVVEGPSCEGNIEGGCGILAGKCFDTFIRFGCSLGSEIGPWGIPVCVSTVLYCTSVWLECNNGLDHLCSKASSKDRTSVDPNDIVGPSGYGSAGWFHPTGQAFQYTLSFNNLPTATNPATNVYLTDTFDPAKYALSTLAIGAVVFGTHTYTPAFVPLASQSFSQDIDLRPSQDLIVRVTAGLNPATNQVNVSLLSLDPATGLEPTDATIGFLAPGAGGAVIFSVEPKASLTTGTAFSDQGSVIFDANAAIATPIWTNTVDVTPPASHVETLPAIEPGPDFKVSWTGSDQGSGIQSYAIYVSDNRGKVTPWIENTRGLSATWKGKLHHTYAFFSIATDNVGNVEAAKVRADALTKVDPLAKTVLTVSRKEAPLNTTLRFTAEVTAPTGDPAPAGSVRFYSGGSKLLGNPSLKDGKAVISTNDLPAGTHDVVAIYGGDAVFPKSESGSVNIEITRLALSVRLQASTNSGKTGEVILFTASVAGEKPAPTGTVVFYIDGKESAVRSLVKGQAEFSVKFEIASTHAIKAVYKGNDDYLPESSTIIEEKISD